MPFSTVCFRRHPPGLDDEDELRRLNAGLVERINASGAALVSHAEVGGRFAVRVAIGNAGTRGEHVQRLWDELRGG